MQYQPRVGLADGTVIGMELMLEWQRPEAGRMSGKSLLPLLEDMDLMTAVWTSMLREGCRQCRSWQTLGLNSLRLTINLSARQLLDSTLLASVRQTLSESGLPPQLLEFDFAEAALADDSEQKLCMLSGLKQLGVTLCCDGFAGQDATLGRLIELPLDKLKIDLTRITRLTSHQYQTGLLTSLAATAKSLQLELLAEGVQSREQLGWLADLNCLEVQGDWLSQPLAVEQVEAFVRRMQVEASDRRAKHQLCPSI